MMTHELRRKKNVIVRVTSEWNDDVKIRQEWPTSKASTGGQERQPSAPSCNTSRNILARVPRGPLRIISQVTGYF